MDTMMYFWTVSHLLKIFVLPEIEKRIKDGRIKTGQLPVPVLRFRAVQRRLADGSIEPIVELNQEVQLLVEAKAKRAIAAGESVTLDDIDPEECFIAPPVYDGRPAAYFLCEYVAFGYSLAFDCSPNTPGVTQEELEQAKVRFPVLEFINAKEFRDQVKPDEKLDILAKNNWPPAPGYYPQALLFIHNNPAKLSEGSFLEAVRKSYDESFWERRLNFWKDTNFFPNRLGYIRTAIEEHLEKRYICSIYVVVPQFEFLFS